MDYLPIFIELEELFEDLTCEEIGQIVRASIEYAENGIEPEFEHRSALGLTWKQMRKRIDEEVLGGAESDS